MRNYLPIDSKHPRLFLASLQMINCAYVRRFKVCLASHVTQNYLKGDYLKEIEPLFIPT